VRWDIIIVGGGIVGAATAWQLSQRLPGRRLLLLEKEQDVALHQSGRNSGVIHAGVYYPPGSLKAAFCRRGAEATVRFCQQQGLPWERCGKLLVATDEASLARLQSLAQRCRDNGVAVEPLDGAALEQREPGIEGLAALRVPTTGMTDYATICRRLIDLFRGNGGEVRIAAPVLRIDEHADAIEAISTGETFRGRFLVACAGIMADRLVRSQGLAAEFRMVPFRGEYFQLRQPARLPLRHHIYPVPDPALPFLGIHLTRHIDGSISVGPNAVLALGREAYRGLQAERSTLAELATFPGFWRLLGRYWRTGAGELRDSLFAAAYLRRVRAFCPSLQLSDLKPAPAGIRAQAVRRDGSLVQDFLFVRSRRALHVCNAPSPAATSALPIADHLCGEITGALASL
jgi:L-2-hydroxyglutarate oxidase